MSPDKPKLYRTWIALVLGYGFCFLILVYIVNDLIIKGLDPVGLIMFVTGLSISMFSLTFMRYGNQEVDEPFSLWEDEKVLVNLKTPAIVSYPFHRENHSVIRGHVSGTTGPYKFVLGEFFGTKYSMLETVKPRTYLNGKYGKKVDIGPISLPPGTYVLQFRDYNNMEASFTLNGTQRKKPYEHIYQLGLTLLEVGVPVLITGSILLAFGVAL